MIVIQKYFRGWKARQELQEMKYRLRVEASVVIIQKYFRGWKVMYCVSMGNHMDLSAIWEQLHEQ